MIDLIVRTIELPRELPLRQVLKFKTAHREELAIFRREISRMTSEIPEGISIEALRQTLHDQFEAEVLPALRSLRHSMKAARWDTALGGFLKVSCFSVPTTAVASMLNIVSPTFALMAGAGISITATAAQLINEHQRAKLGSPYSYLLSLENER